VSADQHLTVIFGYWTPGGDQLQIEDFRQRSLLTDEDRALLRQSLASGTIVMRGGSATNRAGVESPRARMIVVFTGPLALLVRLAQPDASSVLYVQDQGTFKQFPSDVALLTRAVEFTPVRQDLLSYSIERASMGRTGGSISLPSAPQAEPRRNDSASPPRQAGGRVIPPQKIKNVAPVTPPEALRAGIRGVVILEIVIDVSGKVSKASVLRSLPMLDQAALDCVRQWEYTPTLVNGVPVPITTTVSVAFN
jgi:TonB family protein